MMNKWEQVANIFGLELNEEFELLDKNGKKIEEKYYFSNEGIMNEHTVCYGILKRLLYDGYTIFKKPWKPKDKETYWFVVYDNGCALNTFWVGNIPDLMYWHAGNCFKTKEEAETKGKEIMEQIKRKYEES